jgi:hypothetical protein
MCVVSRARRHGVTDFDIGSDCRMRLRLKGIALFAAAFLSVGVWPHGAAQGQSSVGPPLSLAPPRGGTDQASPPAATSNLANPGASSPRSTAKGAPPPSTTNVWPPTASDDAPPPATTVRRPASSAAAKNPPLTASSKAARLPDRENHSPTPAPQSKPAADYDGFSVSIDEGEDTGHPLPIGPRPAKQPKLRQKPDTAEGSSKMQSLDDQTQDEKLKPKLTICRGC